MTTGYRRRCSVLAFASLLAVLGATVRGAAQSPTPAIDLQREVVAELNRARTQPAAYADFLGTRRPAYQGDKTLVLPNQVPLQTEEGVAALDEAVGALRALAGPLPPLTPDEGLAAAARDLAADQSRTGGMGHTGSDGSTLLDRLARYGQLQGEAGENLCYGPATAEEIVFSLIVDDGVADRGHRRNILDENFRLVGVAAAPHPQAGNVCVMDFAQAYNRQP